MLTREQKEHRVCVCQDLLNQYEAEGDSLLGHIITGDETCCTAEVRGSKGIPPAAPRPPAVGARRTSRRKRSSRPTGGAAERRAEQGDGASRSTSGRRGAWRGSGRRRGRPPRGSYWPRGAAEVRGPKGGGIGVRGSPGSESCWKAATGLGRDRGAGLWCSLRGLPGHRCSGSCCISLRCFGLSGLLGCLGYTERRGIVLGPHAKCVIQLMCFILENTGSQIYVVPKSSGVNKV